MFKLRTLYDYGLGWDRIQAGMFILIILNLLFAFLYNIQSTVACIIFIPS
jgi:hypothetical protein